MLLTLNHINDTFCQSGEKTRPGAGKETLMTLMTVTVRVGNCLSLTHRSVTARLSAAVGAQHEVPRHAVAGGGYREVYPGRSTGGIPGGYTSLYPGGVHPLYTQVGYLLPACQPGGIPPPCMSTRWVTLLSV